MSQHRSPNANGGTAEGLYARRGAAITQFTGVDDPYEPPKNPELIIDTTQVYAGARPSTWCSPSGRKGPPLSGRRPPRGRFRYQPWS